MEVLGFGRLGGVTGLLALLRLLAGAAAAGLPPRTSLILGDVFQSLFGQQCSPHRTGHHGPVTHTLVSMCWPTVPSAEPSGPLKLRLTASLPGLLLAVVAGDLHAHGRGVLLIC